MDAHLKVLVVDDHEMIIEGICLNLKALANDVVTISASDCAGAMLQVKANPDLDLVLLDIELPDGNGIALLERIRDILPLVPIVIISGNNDAELARHAIDRGARGFIPKLETKALMLSALNLVLQGGIYLPSLLLHSQNKPSFENHAPQNKALLTLRQREVLHLLVSGKSNKVIARLLDIAEPTVRVHVGAILKMLGATNRTEAANIALKMGLLNANS